MHFFDTAQDQGSTQDTGDWFAERVMAEEFNLAVQREPGWQKATPGGILQQMLGYWLSERSR